MDDSEIQALATKLDASVPREAAQIDLQYGEGEDGLRLAANRAGFIRLALECLRAATLPLRPGREVLQVDWRYLFVKGSGMFSQISRTETVVGPGPALTRREKAANLARTMLAFGFFIFLLISMMVGCYTILSKIPYWR